MNSPLPSAHWLSRLQAPRALAAAAVVMLPLTLGLHAAAQDADPVVARVNGTDIRASDVAIAEEDVGQNMSQMAGEARRDYLTTYVTDMLLVAKAAETKKLTDGKDFKQRLAYYRNKILMEMLLQSEAKAASSDAAMHQLYDDATKQMAGQKEVRARHILVKSEDEAKAVLAELKNGADFAELARLQSEDASSSRGGDLGWLSPGDTVPEFERAMNALEPGQVSEPVQSSFGWHLIQVLERRNEDMSKERQRLLARQAIRARKSDEAYQEWVRQQRDRAYVELRLEER